MSETEYQDLIPQNKLQAAQISSMAAGGVELLQLTQRGMLENTAAMGRWILASLLAMNSGAAVAVMSAADKVEGPIGEPLIAFAIGASLAVATGVNALVTSLRAGPILGRSIELLRLSQYENTILATTQSEVAKLNPIVKQQLTISALLATGSLAAFAFGVGSAVS